MERNVYMVYEHLLYISKKKKNMKKFVQKKLHSYFGSRPGFEPTNQQNDTFDVNLRLSYRGHNLKY